ncbi:MAG: tRNA 2-thiouridine(34) synthase MnmA [Spirochaetia bacterium]|nr:tRNA 2-thiouridine(34) synthase MnmA [Spirochaetia bacterium]
MIIEKQKILVAMSGGVDSAVSALILKNENYSVTGVNLRVFEYDTGCKSDRSCCSPEDIQDARISASAMDIPFYVLKMEEEFKKRVIDRFKDDYSKARTPNPCVDCNTFIKFGALLEKASALGIDRIATGHYAKTIQLENGRWSVADGADQIKNQSYYLYGLSQEAIQSTVFPLGNMQKSEVRKIAKLNGLPVAEKKESQEICFIPDNDYRNFLKKEGVLFTPGVFKTSDGKILGEHSGKEQFTIGQRRGMGIAFSEPLYVLAIEENGDVILGTEKETYKNGFKIEQVNFQGLDPEFFKKDHRQILYPCKIQIRYRSKPVNAGIRYAGHSSKIAWNGFEEGDSILVTMNEPVSSVTPGQSAVIYSDENSEHPGAVLAGGIISR